uniref:Uncharacterized protein n=1 Tax=Anolis carolinensis TaxID=28377 RepID=A0A803SU72_ANOCA
MLGTHRLLVELGSSTGRVSNTTMLAEGGQQLTAQPQFTFAVTYNDVSLRGQGALKKTSILWRKGDLILHPRQNPAWLSHI